MILAIDPGPGVSGVVVLDNDGKVEAAAVESVEDTSHRVSLCGPCRVSVVIERPKFRALRQAGGKSVNTTDTALVAGLFAGIAIGTNARVCYVSRPNVKRILLGSDRVKSADSRLRLALMESYGWTKRKDVPKGLKSHAWQALALGVAYLRAPEIGEPVVE